MNNFKIWRRAKNSPSFPNQPAGFLEQTRLSQLPSDRKQNAVFCVSCQTKLTTDNRPLEGFKVCRKCLNVYALIDLELNKIADRKSRDARLARMQRKIAFQE